MNQMEETRSTTSIIKICRVCGDRAIGFNFNGLTCESCKSFFRRNGRNYEKYFCRKNGNCPIDFVTRKCCAKCRLDKCFLAGMKRELICRKLDRPERTNRSSHSTNRIHRKIESTSKNGGNVDRLLQNQIESQLGSLDSISDPSISLPSPIAASPLNLEIISAPLPLPPSRSSIKLNASETDLIDEIRLANESAAFFELNRGFRIVGEVNDLIYALNLAEPYIGKTIKFCKCISAYRTLKQEDQLLILKDFFLEMMLIRFGFVYDPEHEAIPVIEDEIEQRAVIIKLNILYKANKQDLLSYCKHNLAWGHQELENDTTIRDILMAQRLFKPRNDISCPEYIRYQHCIYTRLFHRYLEDKYGDAVMAAEKLRRFNQLILEFNTARDILEGIFLEIDSRQMSMLLNEVFDLSHT